MICRNTNCQLRKNDMTDVYHCDCAFVCPNRDDGTVIIATDKTEPTEQRYSHRTIGEFKQ